MCILSITQIYFEIFDIFQRSNSYKVAEYQLELHYHAIKCLEY